MRNVSQRQFFSSCNTTWSKSDGSSRALSVWEIIPITNRAIDVSNLHQPGVVLSDYPAPPITPEVSLISDPRDRGSQNTLLPRHRGQSYREQVIMPPSRPRRNYLLITHPVTHSTGRKKAGNKCENDARLSPFGYTTVFHNSARSVLDRVTLGAVE